MKGYRVGPRCRGGTGPCAWRLAGGVQGVGGGPGGISRAAGVSGGEVADLLRGVTGGPGGMLVDGVALSGGEDAGGIGGAGWCPAVAQFGQGQVGGEFSAAVPDRASGIGGADGEGDGVAGDLAGVAGAEPLADADAYGIEAGEELLLAACGGRGGGDRAAQRDPGGSPRPWRRAFSDSARVGRCAAVRSRGAVRRSPNRSSAAWQASPMR